MNYQGKLEASKASGENRIRNNIKYINISLQKDNPVIPEVKGFFPKTRLKTRKTKG